MRETVLDDILNIPTRQLVSDMPDTFTATVKSASSIQGTYGKSLKLDLLTRDNVAVTVMYRIPQALTGKGQLDQLLASLKQLEVPLRDIQGHSFEWQRKELQGTMKGNPRHYPIRVVE